MIISKKRFEAEIQKAVNKREDELWKQRQQENETRDIWHSIYELRERLDKIEGKYIYPTAPTCEPCNPANVRVR